VCCVFDVLEGGNALLEGLHSAAGSTGVCCCLERVGVGRWFVRGIQQLALQLALVCAAVWLSLDCLLTTYCCLLCGCVPSTLMLPQKTQAEWPTLSLSSGGIFSISTFALSLLLVFRTNSSYEVSCSLCGLTSPL
jgi:hypothetical protein